MKNALGVLWYLRWRLYVALACALLSSVGITARVLSHDLVQQSQIVLGWLILMGLLAGLLKGLGSIIRLIVRRPDPPRPKGWRRSSWAALGALLAEVVAALLPQAFVPVVYGAWALIFAMLVWAVQEVRADQSIVEAVVMREPASQPPRAPQRPPPLPKTRPPAPSRDPS